MLDGHRPLHRCGLNMAKDNYYCRYYTYLYMIYHDLTAQYMIWLVKYKWHRFSETLPSGFEYHRLGRCELWSKPARHWDGDIADIVFSDPIILGNQWEHIMCTGINKKSPKLSFSGWFQCKCRWLFLSCTCNCICLSPRTDCPSRRESDNGTGVICGNWQVIMNDCNTSDFRQSPGRRCTVGLICFGAMLQPGCGMWIPCTAKSHLFRSGVEPKSDPFFRMHRHSKPLSRMSSLNCRRETRMVHV